jgi:DNA-binding winged helix-turn-helix (wHTH) protein/tetratricopeptide (TPR) repeat protein
LPAPKIRYFSNFALDRENQSLYRDGTPIPLTPKAFAVLAYLVDHPGRLIAKNELLDSVWPDTFVQEAVLKTCILEIRKALGDNAHESRFVETLHKRGYRFLALLSDEPTVDGKAMPSTALLGRTKELARLSAAFDRASAGGRQVIFIGGEPGIGKSTLVQHFTRDLRSRGIARIAYAQCVEHFGEAEPYYPILSALAHGANDWGKSWVADILRTHAPTWLVQMPSLVVPNEVRALRADLLGATRERMLREMSDAIDKFAEARTLVLILEDLHWSDTSTLDLVSWIARQQTSARVLVIATYRPVEVILTGHPLSALKQDLQGRGLCSEICPGLLNVDGIRELVELRFQQHEFPAQFAELLHKHTDGNPLFLINVLDYLVSRSLLVREGSGWRLQGSLHELNMGVPDSLLQIINKQLGRLSDSERSLLESGSVAGVEFCVAHLAEWDEAENTEQRFDHLARRQLFIRRGSIREWPDGCASTSYAFIHSLYREVLYDNIPFAQRARLHRQIAERIEALSANHLEEAASELAMHFEQARSYDQAIRYLKLAAKTASSRHAHTEALVMLRRAQELCARLKSDERSRETVLVLERIGLVHRLMGQLEQADATFASMLEQARLAHDYRSELRARLWRASVLSWINRAGCLENVDRAMELCPRVDDPLSLGSVRGQVAYWNLLFRGWDARDLTASAQAVDVVRASSDLALLSLHAGRHVFFLCLAGRYEEAASTAEDSIKAALDVNDLTDYSVSHFFAVWALLHAGEWGKFRQLLNNAIGMATRNGHELWLTLFRLLEAWFYNYAGAYGEAAEVSMQCSERAKALGHPLSQQMSSILLGRALMVWESTIALLRASKRCVVGKHGIGF